MAMAWELVFLSSLCRRLPRPSDEILSIIKLPLLISLPRARLVPILTVLLTFPFIGKIIFVVNQASQQQFSISVTWERGEGRYSMLGKE